MKHLLLTTIEAVVLVGCGKSQQSAPSPETKPVEPVAEAATPEPTMDGLWLYLVLLSGGLVLLLLRRRRGRGQGDDQDEN